MHVPQSFVTENELRAIAAVPYQIMSPKECKPLIAVVQDVALGIYRLTKKHIFLSEKQLFNLMSTNTKFFGSLPAPAVVDGDIKRWSGKQALSSIIPASVNMKSANNSYDEKVDDKDNFVIIENGEIKQGTIDKKIYQNRTKGLIHSIYNDCNEEETRHFFDNTQKLICNWLVQSGFSVGISDLIVDEETQSNIKNIINQMKVQVYDTIKDVHMNKFENLSINDNHDFFETEINKILNKAREQTGKLGLSKINDLENRMINMIKSGSKGSVINVAQMIACVGQQNVDGKRIAYGFDNRTLPHFVKYDDGPDSRGFVENSFISGLSPQEFFFHSMGGREGLIDTAVKSVTADTEIIILEDGRPKCVQIGPWIDGHMARGAARVQYKEEKHTELLQLDNEVLIPNMDSKGNMAWSPMKYVTRHDPDQVLYEVETESGRRVIVTQYDSMLVWDEEKEEFLSKPTPEIKIGEFVPITSKMPAPPITLKYVDVVDYMPKTEYLYGTDFHTAKNMMEEAMQGRDKIPVGWWEEHNGKDFTLPYTKKASLQRVLVRSDVNSIKEGCVHNYAAQRGECAIPDKFPLDKDFGTFIGLYLAEGCSHVKSGKVSIANQDPKVLEFMIDWFNKYDITHKIYARDMDLKNKEGDVMSKGFTCSINGNSTMLAKFLDKFVGHGAANKFVPVEAYAAPEEFIVGIINGYLAGDGSVNKHGVQVSSVSRSLIEGIAMLCSRLGAFGRIRTSQSTKNNIGTEILPTHTLDIRSCFAERIRHKLDLIIDYKNKALEDMSCSKAHRNFAEVQDAVMDPVKSIREVDITNFKRVYDVTVPGSYNFTLKNGLNTRDTSETGYLQRKLVKAMEDCKINYDYTVRNASGSIIQFLYGEDGMDPIKIEAQSLPYIDMDYQKLQDEYLITKSDNMEAFVNDEVMGQLAGDWEAPLKAHFDQVVKDREFMIVEIFKRKQNNSFMYPVSFTRIINNARAMMKRYGITVRSDLHPQYILDSIEKLNKELFINKNNRGDRFISMMVRAYLSPKQVIKSYRFNKDTFDYVLQQVKLRFFEAIAHPSEMVGVVAAQSIGEPCTQLSCLKTSKVLISTKDKTKSFYGTMGDFIDTMLDQNKDKVVDLGNDSVVFDPTDDYYIVGVSDKEKTSWRRILQVSRHPANGGMVKVHTRSGKTTCATLSHSFLKRTTDSIVPVKGSALKVGDRIPVARSIPQVSDPLERIDGFDLDREMGWFIGMYLADGKSTEGMPNLDFIKSHFDITSHIPGWVFNSNIEFIEGILKGFFGGDGIGWAHSDNAALVDGIIMLLAYTGVFASKTDKKDGIYGIVVHKDTQSADSIDKIPELGKLITFVENELHTDTVAKLQEEAIGRSTLVKYIDQFEAANATKQIKAVSSAIEVLKQAANSDVVWDEITELEYLEDPMEHVYDFTVPGNDSFMVDCGVLVHNTLNSVDYHTELLLKVDERLERVKIGEFIDRAIASATPINTENHPNDTTLTWIKEKQIKVLSCDEDGKIKWEDVEAVTKHPPINKDGTSTLLKVTLQSGREVIATKAKSFLKRHNNKIVEVNGDELKVGDFLPVSMVLPVVTLDDPSLTRGLGYTHGSSLVTSEARIDPVLFGAPIEYLSGICDGFFAKQENTKASRGVMEDIQQVLLRVGEQSSITNGTLVRGSRQDVIHDIDTDAYGLISVHRDRLPEFMADPRLSEEDRIIMKRAMEEDIMYDKVTKIEDYKSDHPYVYDLTVSNTKNFNVYNGLAMRDTFHHSGISSASKAVRGVPRIKELLSVTKSMKGPAMTIYIKDEYRRDKMQSNEVLKSIQTTFFKDIVRSSRIYYDSKDFSTDIEEDALFVNSYRELVESEVIRAPDTAPWLLRIEINRERLLEEGITMIDLYNILQDYYEDTISCMFSDDNSHNLIFRIKFIDDPSADEERDYITELKALEKNIMENILIKGVKGVHKAMMNKQESSIYNEDTMQFEKSHEWVIDSSGTCLVDIMAHPRVDFTRTISNDVNEIYDLLGIEAARAALYNELSGVIADAELYVNYRHIALLVDTMTNRGYLLSIDRHGINRVDIGPLAKCSFEETTDMLIKAGIFAEVDKITGVSANIMLGQIPPCGTGDAEILIDEHKLINQARADAPEPAIEDDNACAFDTLTFDFRPPARDDELEVVKDFEVRVV